MYRYSSEYYIDIFSRRYAKKFEVGVVNGSLRDEDNADAAVAKANGGRIDCGKSSST